MIGRGVGAHEGSYPGGGCRPLMAAVVEMAPVSRPRPSGLYGTMPTPSSRQAGTTSASMSRVNSDHSVCTAVIGWTPAGQDIRHHRLLIRRGEDAEGAYWPG
jgi:hypothetical protein